MLISYSYAVCLPSYYREGVPRFLIEGLCQAKPIITTNCAGCKETVLDKINGFIPLEICLFIIFAISFALTFNDSI